MTIAAQTEAAIASEGRRAGVDKAPGAVATAFAELGDRHRSVDQHIEALASAIAVLTTKLEPVLTDGSPAPYPVDPGVAGSSTPQPEDRRSMVARSLSAEALIANRQVLALDELVQRVNAITEAVEV